MSRQKDKKVKYESNKVYIEGVRKIIGNRSKYRIKI